MDHLKRRQLLFIDAHEEWLLWVQSTLQRQYDVNICSVFSTLVEMLGAGLKFDLILVDSDIAEQDIATFEFLSRTQDCSFVVLFPGFPEKRAARNLFKAGALDVVGKPYPLDQLALENLVNESITLLTEQRKMIPIEQMSAIEYRARTHALAKHIGVALSGRPEEIRVSAERMASCFG